jgi:hypothetical protein
MHRVHYWFIVIALAAAAAYCFWYAFKAWVKNRTIEDTPTARIRSAAQGYVKLAGLGELPPKSNVKGPLTGIPCTWWHYKIEERGASSRSRGWSTLESETSETPFLLDDGTGQCLVDPQGAEVLPHARDVWYGPDPWPEVRIPPGEGIFGWIVDALFTDRYRYTERRLQPREHLYALGEFRSGGGVSAVDPDDAVAQLLHHWKQDQAKLLARFDTNHDGAIDAGEWERVRAAARAQVLAERGAQAPQPESHLLAAPGDGRSFLLAAADDTTLARRFRRRALASIAGFVAATAALAWFLGAVH